MALKATIFKVQLNIADMDRGYYQDHSLTLAQHPSENDQRLMVRLLAFILNADEQLEFSKGLSSEEDEAELWLRDYARQIKLWVEFGQSDEKWIRKACGRADKVQLFAYGGKSVPPWWAQNELAFTRYNNLTVWNIAEESVAEMGAMANRNMSLQATITDGEVLLSDGDNSVTIVPERLKEGAS